MDLEISRKRKITKKKKPFKVYLTGLNRIKKLKIEDLTNVFPY